MEKYQIIRLIGDGTFGKVYEGLNKYTNERVAIKKLKEKIPSWEECIEQNEVRILKKLHNENIIRLIEVIREQNSDVSFVFEYCECNLYEFIEINRRRNIYLSEAKIRNIILQITSGLNYLHSQRIMHRDLKPENLLMNLRSNLLKIADFGTAKEIPEYKNNSLTDYVCTRWYRSPECVLKLTNYDEKSDIWAIGCIMAELYTYKPIFPGDDQLDQLNKIAKIIGPLEYNTWPEGFSLLQKMGVRLPNYNKANLKELIFGANDDAISFLELIFQFDPKKRPSCSELLLHPYFTEVQRPYSYTYQSRNYKFKKEFFGQAEPNFFTSTFINNSLPYNFNSLTSRNSYNNFNNEKYSSFTHNISNGLYNNNSNNNNNITIYDNSFTNNTNKVLFLGKEPSNTLNLNYYRDYPKNSERNVRDKNVQIDASKNNYNYYKNFVFSKYLSNDSTLSDINKSLNSNITNITSIQNSYGNAFNKYSSNYPLISNSLTNSYNKFSSFARNDILQNIGKEKPIIINKRFGVERFPENSQKFPTLSINNNIFNGSYNNEINSNSSYYFSNKDINSFNFSDKKELPKSFETMYNPGGIY